MQQAVSRRVAATRKFPRLPRFLVAAQIMAKQRADNWLSAQQQLRPYKERAMPQRYKPGLFDRLLDDHAADTAAAAWTLERVKQAVARDLEALFNTRAALPASTLAAYPDVAGSVLNYGLIDFAGMCLTSDSDQKKICAAVQLAVQRHEPRLHGAVATLQVHHALINRVGFVITATLKTGAGSEQLLFDAVLQQSTQQYSIRKAGDAADSVR
jgi:type VI secretion system protein ImpF